MALERKDNIGDTTTTTGTGTLNLAAVAQSGARIFAGNVTSGATVRYDIRSSDNTEWEIGEGVFTDGSPDTLTRVTVYASSNAGALVNFSAGTKNVSMVLTAQDMKDISVIPLFAPQGFLINGKIVPSVSSSNLTVALKTLAGTDPSTSDPVYIRIGDTVYTITSAKSISLAGGSGVSLFNAGSAELATKEIDWFVYLGVKISDGSLHLIQSRIPSATLGSHFNTSASSEKYGRVGDATYPPSDIGACEVIGRFAATLSASPYNWSVPTFTTENLIQRPIYETRWLTWSPQTTAATGSYTLTSLVAAKYKITGNVLKGNVQLLGTTSSTTQNIRASIPFNAYNVDTFTYGYTTDGGSAQGSEGILASGTNLILCYKYSFGNYAATTNQALRAVFDAEI